MCIVLIATAHAEYPLVLLDNRDEFITRPTSRAAWWPPSAHVLGARDLLRPEHGAWMGVARDGRFAVLTNVRERTASAASGAAHSRGAMVSAWLESSDRADAFAQRLGPDAMRDVGGFSLLCGHAPTRRGRAPALALVSNRAADGSAVWLHNDEGDNSENVYGLSNSEFDRPWPKVVRGKQMLADTLKEHAGLSKDDLIRRLFGILDYETLPSRVDGQSFEDYLDNVQHSIFIPPIGGRADYEEYTRSTMQPTPTTDRPQTSSPDMLGVYGTQRQTVLLLDKHGHVTFVERRLFDDDGRAIPRGEGDDTVEFDIEGFE